MKDLKETMALLMVDLTTANNYVFLSLHSKLRMTEGGAWWQQPRPRQCWHWSWSCGWRVDRCCCGRMRRMRRGRGPGWSMSRAEKLGGDQDLVGGGPGGQGLN